MLLRDLTEWTSHGLSIRFTSTPPWIQIQQVQLTGLFGSEGAAQCFSSQNHNIHQLKCMGNLTNLTRFMVMLKALKGATNVIVFLTYTTY